MKELNISIVEEQENNGVTEQVSTHTIVRAAPGKVKVDGAWVPNTENAGRFVRLHDLYTNETYLWGGDPFEVDENTDTDDPRWAKE